VAGFRPIGVYDNLLTNAGFEGSHTGGYKRVLFGI
jgi:hypothetical protein